MNQVVQLYKISQKKTRRIIGLMSGTSLDGLDIAICDITGFGAKTIVKPVYFETAAYDATIRTKLSEVFAQEAVNSEKLSLLHNQLPVVYHNYLEKALNCAGISFHEIDLIASHGQTVFHFPKTKKFNSVPSTFQVGDGDHLAFLTGVITLSDFRQKHVAAGGEGAPLAIYADRILFSHPEKSRILLNLGGIANFTYLPALQSIDKAITMDTGPANTLIDRFCEKHLQMPFDMHGKIAFSGKVIPALLDELLRHEYFSIGFPKSTGQEAFHLSWVEQCIKKTVNQKYIPKEDIITTLSLLTIETIFEQIDKLGVNNSDVEYYASGGGFHNEFIIKGLEKKLKASISSTEILGIHGDAKEAVMMAVLANETVCGQPFYEDLPEMEKFPSVTFGKISFPK